MLVARGSAKPQNPVAEIDAAAENALREKLKSNPELAKSPELPEVKRQIVEQILAEYQVVPPGYQRVWKIDLGPEKDSLRGKPLQLRIKFNASQQGAGGTLAGVWQAGDPQTSWQSEPMSLSPDTFHEFQIPADMMDDKGMLTVAFVNVNGGAMVLFPIEDGMEVLYPQGGFAMNFARGLGIIFCWMALLAALGLAAASFLSFPVAAFCSLAMLVIVLCSGTLADAVGTGSVAAGNEETGTPGHSVGRRGADPGVQGDADGRQSRERFFARGFLEHRTRHHLGRTRPGVRADCPAAGRHHRSHRHRAVQPARTGHGTGDPMNLRVKKILLLLLAVALIVGAGQTQNSLNRDRDRLGLTHAATLQNAPPMLVFTTVALGGFRGLISNYLWIRADDLQQDDKYFEAAQLASWITDLEPHLPVVWVFQAWNMAYNISIKFKENAPGDYSDRWRWINNGIELLRDKGLLYNPNDPLIYFQLGQFFGNKIGQNLDDGNLFYKEQWAQEMTPFFGPRGTNFADLIHPQTAEDRTNALVLREQYKIDPVFAQKVNEEYGPLDWRLPEAHAIYWYALGLERATTNFDKVKPSDIDLMQLRRGIYQCEQQAFRHGHMIVNPFTHTVELAPDLDLIPKANDSYLQMYAEEPDAGQKANIQLAQRNFLRSAVKFLYQNDRMAEAAKWFKYLGDKYPDVPLIEGQTNSFAEKPDAR